MVVGLGVGRDGLGVGLSVEWWGRVGRIGRAGWSGGVVGRGGRVSQSGIAGSVERGGMGCGGWVR